MIFAVEPLFKNSSVMLSCPHCNSIHQKRKKRNFFLKLIPTSRLFKCFDCKLEYAYIFNFLKITTKKSAIYNQKTSSKLEHN